MNKKITRISIWLFYTIQQKLFLYFALEEVTNKNCNFFQKKFSLSTCISGIWVTFKSMKKPVYHLMARTSLNLESVEERLFSSLILLRFVSYLQDLNAEWSYLVENTERTIYDKGLKLPLKMNIIFQFLLS